MTVSITTLATVAQGSNVVTTARPSSASSMCYTTTRSAAMMALAFGGGGGGGGGGKHNKSPGSGKQTARSNSVSGATVSGKYHANSPSPPAASTSATNIAKPTSIAPTTGKGRENASSSAPTTRKSSMATNSATMSPTIFSYKPPGPSQAQAQNNTSTTAAAAGGGGGPNNTGSSFSGGSASSGSDNDGFNTSSSSSATALRRLYFKSGRSMKNKLNSSVTASMMNIPMKAVSTAAAVYHTSVGSLPPALANAAGVPKVVIMGSSSASIPEPDANINTSTDSASTLVTSVTHTDTSETCDSLDLGDNSGQSEPLFSSLEEPLLTAIQIDSEHEGTELELTSRSIYKRPDMNVQDSTESQESCLSILTGEPSSTVPLLASHRRHNPHDHQTSDRRAVGGGKADESERLPKTAPAPGSGNKHFVFDPPHSPKSARSSEKNQNHFVFRDSTAVSSSSTSTAASNQQQQQRRQKSPKQGRSAYDGECVYDVERHHSPTRRATSPGKGGSGSYRSPGGGSRNSYYDNDGDMEIERQLQDRGDLSGSVRRKKSRGRDSNSTSHSRNRYSTGETVVGSAIKTSPKREGKCSPSSSKISSAPPTMKDGNFFAHKPQPQQLSPSSQKQQVINQRKYSSSSSSGGSDRGRERSGSVIRDSTMFPFDREAIDYERIQRECFAVEENSSSNHTSSDSEEGESCSVYERQLTSHHGSPKSSEMFQQYTLLNAQHEQPAVDGSNGAEHLPPLRKNSKRIRPSSVMHSTIRENQQYVPESDAFHPQQKNSSSPGEISKFEDIATKFEQIPPKYPSNVNLSALNKSPSPSSSAKLNNNIIGGGMKMTSISPTGSMRDVTPSASASALPNVRVDYLTEAQMHARKKSFKNKANAGTGTAPTHDQLDKSQNATVAASNVPVNDTAAAAATATAAAGSINVTANPMEAAVCTQPRATIVVQQPSLSLDNTVETLLIKSEGDFISVEQGKEITKSGGPTTTTTATISTTTTALGRKRSSAQLHHAQHLHQQQKRDENMRQLLDVTNTLTFEELRDFEQRYGSPHHSRSQSVKAPGSRASGRPNQLCLPQQRSRVASMPNTGVEEEYYRLRHFSITGKGIVNRGDSLKSRRSRSNNSVASSNSSTEHLTAQQIPAPNSARTSATCSLASSRESSTSNPGSGPFRVLMLGGPAVGKSSLVSQFMTSEYLHAYDTSIDDESGEKTVSVLLSGEESELIFIDHPYTEMTPDDCLSSFDPHGYCVIYSASDRCSFTLAEHVLQVLWTNQNIAQKAVILVANKADLARSRSVTSEEGKAMATAYDCKFIETSVGINHNVDELLVGLLTQIRLKLENPEKSRDLFRKRSIRKSKRRACSPLSGACLTGGTNPNTPLGGPLNNIVADANTPPSSAHSSPRKYRGSRTSTSLKVKGLLGRVWARDSKSKSCENLHVL